MHGPYANGMPTGYPSKGRGLRYTARNGTVTPILVITLLYH